MVAKCLILLEARAGIEPTYTALQAAVLSHLFPSIHAGLRQLSTDDYF